MVKKFLILAVTSFLQLTTLYPQTPSYYHYTTTDGLASSTVFNIIQDREGFIWCATLNGISRFDRKRFTTYRAHDGLNSNTITSLVEGDNGELYIGNYERGINVLKNGRIENYCSEIDGKSFATSYLLLVHSMKDQNKLYAYRSWNPINVIQGKTTSGHSNYTISTTPLFINRLEKLPDGNVIALTTTGIFNFKNNSFTKLRITGFHDNNVYCLTVGNDGEYLVGTKGMIYRIKDNNVTGKYKIILTGNNDVCAILKDTNNNIWFSIMNKGFFLIPNGSSKIIDIGIKMGLQNTLVNNYCEDKEGNIWVSTFGKGVYCLNNLYLKSYNENDGLSSNNVYSIVKDKSGKLLIGTFNGINILENGKFNHIKSSSKMSLTDYIHSIKDIDDNVYVCGSFNGRKIINISFRGMKFHLFNKPSFCKTSDGLYMFGTWVNAIRIQREFNNRTDGSLTYFIFGDSAKINRVNEIIEDTQKNIWVGTSLGLCKLSKLPGKKGKAAWQKSFFPGDPVLNSKINSIIQDKAGNIWFAGVNG
ncbi:MAG: ligand-binding sensor domain-containing protein, partial [Candidatus Doudnabacteria bacterium]